MPDSTNNNKNDKDEVQAAKADLQAAKARAKALRPWFKKKRFIVPIALVVLLGLSIASDPDGTREAFEEGRESARNDLGTSETAETQDEAVALSAQEACTEATLVVTTINNLNDILLDNYEDQAFVAKMSTSFEDAGAKLSAIRSEDSSIDSAISELGATQTALGTALATGDVLSDEASEAVENALLAAVEIQSACQGY
jgi:flagellin-like hook-associated protein FlgL